MQEKMMTFAAVWPPSKVQLVLCCTCENTSALVQPCKWSVYWRLCTEYLSTCDLTWKHIKVDFILSADRIRLFWFSKCIVWAGLVTAWLFQLVSNGNSPRATRRRKRLTDQGAKIQQIFIKTDEGPNSNAAVFCIPMTLTMAPLLFLTPPFTPQ